MCEVLEKLRAWGCDLDGALERFLGDEELYKSCLPMVAEDEAFDGLKEALAEEKGDANLKRTVTLVKSEAKRS